MIAVIWDHREQEGFAVDFAFDVEVDEKKGTVRGFRTGHLLNNPVVGMVANTAARAGYAYDEERLAFKPDLGLGTPDMMARRMIATLQKEGYQLRHVGHLPPCLQKGNDHDRKTDMDLEPVRLSAVA
ncbi:hypothetical protein HFN60_30220 [Rhizobium leguminosarum]|uniref:hypothetical protein n=1 Tax=Rhizobium leguminosarum TaxID=384 RepID=UPI001C9564C8|nr:hypothetical protein [Rhizobium leguminosarum]MBY5819870.1 hypothetical protein [Rhizobium leguminosarum]